MQLAVAHESVPHTWAWGCSAASHTVGCTAHSRATSRTSHNSVALQCDGRRALVVGRGVAERARRVILVGFWVVVVRSCVGATQDDTRCGELKLTASALVVCPNHEVVVRVRLELWQEAFHRSCASSCNHATHKSGEIVTGVSVQHGKTDRLIGQVGGVEQEGVVVRAVEREVHCISSSSSFPTQVNFLGISSAQVAHERLTGYLSNSSVTVVVRRRCSNRSVTRSRDHEIASAVAFYADVVVHTSHGRPSNRTVESCCATVAVGGNASQRSIDVLSEDGNVRACGVVRFSRKVVQRSVASADSDLLIGVRVENVPHACSAQHVVSVFKAFQSFTVCGVLDGTSGAQTASQSFCVGHVIVGGRQLARAVVHGCRGIIVDARWVGATFKAALASQGEVEAVVLTCTHSGVSCAELVGQLDAHFTWVNVVQDLEVVATRSQAHVVSTHVQTVTSECSGNGATVFEGTRRKVVEVVLCTAPSVAKAVKHVHSQNEGAWIAVHTVTWEGSVRIVVRSSGVLTADAAVVARLVINVRFHVIVASRSVSAAELAVTEVRRLWTSRNDFVAINVEESPRILGLVCTICVVGRDCTSSSVNAQLV